MYVLVEKRVYVTDLNWDDIEDGTCDLIGVAF